MGEHKKYVYLDYAATAPLCEEARFAIRPYFHTFGNDSVCLRGNANSLYTPGRDASIHLEKARKTIADSLNAKRPDEIVFTSSATESTFLALYGMFYANERESIVISNIEHPSVEMAAMAVAGKNNVIKVKVDKFGFIHPEDLEKTLTTATKPLVSIQMANSELASVQDVAQLSKVSHKNGCLFHTDITQAVGKVEVDFQELGVDAASWSSHKIGGPQGVGGLFIKSGIKFQSPIVGGGQERKRRGGTQNVSGAAGFAVSVKASCLKREEEAKRLRELKDKLVVSVCEMVTKTGKNCKLVVDETKATDKNLHATFLPNVATFLVPGFESESIILQLDEKGICVSGGSACSSESTKPSSSLKAVGCSDDEAFSELRVSFGRYTTEEDIDVFIKSFREVIS